MLRDSLLVAGCSESSLPPFIDEAFEANPLKLLKKEVLRGMPDGVGRRE